MLVTCQIVHYAANRASSAAPGRLGGILSDRAWPTTPLDRSRDPDGRLVRVTLRNIGAGDIGAQCRPTCIGR
jgi:hypothetical protein